jgi:homocysteine S-methyltransferase
VPSAPEARALARLLAERPGIPAWLSFTCRDGERISDGTPLEAIVAELEAAPRVLALGVNCTAPRFVASLLERARRATAKPLVAYPNSGERYDAERKRWEASEPATEFGASSREWRARGAAFIGGCCRTGPREIAAVRRALLGTGEREESAPGEVRDETTP